MDIEAQAGTRQPPSQINTEGRVVGDEYILTPDDMPSDRSLWKEVVLQKTQEMGYVVLRNFDLKDAEDFQDFLEHRLTIQPWNVFNKLKVAGPVITFVRRITDGILGAGDNRSYVNSQLQQLGRIDNSVQGPHIEGGVYNKRARYLFMYCEAAPESWGETGVADMSVVFQSLPPDTRDVLSQAWQQFEFTSVKQLNWLERLILTIGRIKHYERKDKFMQMLLDVIPMVCRHPETGKLCPQIWAYRGDTVYNAACDTFAERTPLDRECMADTWQIGWSLKDKDGKTLTNGIDLMDELIKSTFEHSRLICWKQGDIAVVDNLRCSHWRMNGHIDQPRKIFQLQAVPYQATDLAV